MHRRELLTSVLATAAVASLPRPALGQTRRSFKLYDTHAHFFSDDLKRYPFKPDVAPMQKIRTMERPITPDYLFKLWDANGVEMGCGVQYNTTYATDNSYLLDMAAKYPQRIMPVVILPPADPATPATIARMAKINRITGVRFNSPVDAEGNLRFLADATRGVWETANDLGLAIVLILLKTEHLDGVPRAMARIGEFAGRYPNVNIVLDHFGFPPNPGFSPVYSFSSQHKELADRKNVYFKYTTYLIEQLHLAGVRPRDFLHYAADVFGPDHLIWGSDVGNSNGDYGAWVREALGSADGLPLAVQRAIFHDTAKGLFIPGGRAARPA